MILYLEQCMENPLTKWFAIWVFCQLELIYLFCVALDHIKLFVADGLF